MIIIIVFVLLGVGIISAIIHNIIDSWETSKKPYVYNLTDCRYWGHSIQLDVKAKSPHSVRCLPNIEELKTISKIEAFGWMSRPYIIKGDVVICPTFRGNDVKLKFIKVRYTEEPHDMFFAELKLIE